MEYPNIEKLLKDKMLKEIFIKTGGREQNPQIAEICAKIAVKELLEKKGMLLSYIRWYALINGSK
jgi:hypothetical protein